MLKLVKYLKKNIIPILIIVLLLVFQAMCDLALPDYTSKIVNVGIQQGGIEDAVPEAIRENHMEALEVFMTTDEKQTVQQNYTLLDENNLTPEEYQKDVEKYPDLANHPIYELNDHIGSETRDQLNLIFGRALMSVDFLRQSNDHTEAAKQQIAANLSPEQQQKLMQMTPLQVVYAMPQNLRQAVVDEVRAKVDEIEPLFLTQTVAPMVKAEYDAIGIDTSSMQMWYLIRAGIQMVLIALCSLTAVILVVMLASRVAASLSEELRNRLFSKVLAFSNKEMDSFSTASLITRTTNDIQQIQLVMVMLFRIVFYAPIIAIGGIIKVLNTQDSLLWVVGLGVAVISAVVIVLFLFVMPKFRLMQRLVDKLNLVLREILTGLPVIRAFSTQRHEHKRFSVANMDLTRANIFVNRVMACMMPTMMFIMNSIAILVVWVGGHGVDQGTMQVGNMMAVIQYTMQIIMAFLTISMVSVMLPRASVAAKRVEEVLQTEISIQNPDQPKEFDKSKSGVVEFKNVSFRYPGADANVLSDITFTAHPGETTAIIGSTGSGKSTLINLIPRFYDVSEGELLVDGVNVKQADMYQLRDRIGYVPQKGNLFTGDIASNISYGKQLSEEAIENAAEIAQAKEFIESKPDGYHSAISQGGTNVSGGQRQRLSIARAIAIDPEIYIFDDSFSALDYKTDRMLRNELKKATSGATVIIVAQRISTIMQAEKILVLDQGKLVGEGTHQQLMDSCEVYREIAQSQLSKEELDNA